jgi:hypothetical protein
MDEYNELPDDLSQWPKNNWELFSLDSQNVSYKDLRKAYSKLIKRFRPETHPEQFQRIQEAFETLRDLIQSGNKPNSDNQRCSESENEQDIQQRRSKRQNDFLAELYENYIYKADWDGAKYYLESFIEPENPTEEIQEVISDLGEIPYLYLFWILYVTNPSDEDNFPDIFQYLIMGEKAADLEDGMSVSIKTFFFFLERQRLSYKSKIYDYALDHVDFPAIIILLNTRWLNLRFDDEADDVDVIVNDLEKLHSRFIPNYSKEWTRINIEAMEHLLWIDNDKANDALKKCVETISQYPDDRESFDEKLDELDQLEHAIASLRSLPFILPVDLDAIHTLLFMAGNSVFSRYRRIIIKTVSDLADDVLRAFLIFDYLSAYHPMVASQLCDSLHEMYLTRHEKDNNLEEEQANGVLKNILQIVESYNYNYRPCRLSLIKYLLEEKLDPVKASTCISSYLEKNQEDASQKPEVEKLKKWYSELVNDGSVILTFYAVMCCEINGMEDYEDDESR